MSRPPDESAALLCLGLYCDAVTIQGTCRTGVYFNATDRHCMDYYI